MSRSLPGARLAAATALVSLAAAGTAAAQSPDAPLPGYGGEHAAQQRAYEAAFQNGVSAAGAGNTSRRLSRSPGLIGTQGVREDALYSLDRLRGFGLAPRLASYDVWISKPRSIAVTMTAPTQRRLANKEKGFPWQVDFDDVVVGYNAYSPAADVAGEVVYANYGRPEDFAALDALGISVKDRIVLTRYGQNFRGVKVSQAERRGARGVIIYSDPADDGFKKGAVYPDGPFRPADSIQRGSIQYLWQHPGDPLTPGRPSIPGTPRLDPDKATNIARIPSVPISYGEAEPLLRALGGPAAPEGFQGGLDFPYHVGPGSTEVRLNLDIDYEQTRVSNVIAEIPGAVHPEQKVVVGGHYDAWTYGAVDNNSGWTAVTEIGRSLGRLLARGWRPDRTIVLAGWDGEEYGLLGSTEYAEQYARDIRGNVIAYVNMDGVAGATFGGTGVPSLDDVLYAATGAVSKPGTAGSVYDSWKGDRTTPPEVDRPGSGSDYTAFLDRLGVPILNVEFSSPSGEYHSAYDETMQVERFIDPGYLSHAAAARISGVVALRLANADVLPLRYSAYARAVREYVEDLRKTQASTPGAAPTDLVPLLEAATAWEAAAGRLEAAADALVASGDLESTRGARRAARLNARAAAPGAPSHDDLGLPGRPWFRHQVYAPGVTTGYAVQNLPGIRDALTSGDAPTAQKYADALLASLRAAAAAADRAAV